MKGLRAAESHSADRAAHPTHMKTVNFETQTYWQLSSFIIKVILICRFFGFSFVDFFLIFLAWLAEWLSEVQSPFIVSIKAYI